MQILGLFTTLLFAVSALAETATQEPPKELVIDTTFKPEECTQFAAKLDSVKVHYVRAYTVLMDLKSVAHSWSLLCSDWHPVR